MQLSVPSVLRKIDRRPTSCLRHSLLSRWKPTLLMHQQRSRYVCLHTRRADSIPRTFESRFRVLDAERHRPTMSGQRLWLPSELAAWGILLFAGRFVEARGVWKGSVGTMYFWLMLKPSGRGEAAENENAYERFGVGWYTWVTHEPSNFRRFEKAEKKRLKIF